MKIGFTILITLLFSACSSVKEVNKQSLGVCNLSFIVCDTVQLNKDLCYNINLCITFGLNKKKDTYKVNSFARKYFPNCRKVDETTIIKDLSEICIIRNKTLKKAKIFDIEDSVLFMEVHYE